jgi:hypothetical protein
MLIERCRGHRTGIPGGPRSRRPTALPWREEGSDWLSSRWCRASPGAYGDTFQACLTSAALRLFDAFA